MVVTSFSETNAVASPVDDCDRACRGGTALTSGLLLFEEDFFSFVRREGCALE